MSTREKIIDAAMAIVREQGVARLTLDEAAKVAGVSKGGVLYHFASKDDLIRGMVSRLIGQCEGIQKSYYESLPEGRHRWARAVVMTAFDPNGPASDPVGGALLAAVAVNRELVQPLREKYQEWLARMSEEGADLDATMLVCTAMDGLVFHDLIGLNLLNEEARARLKARALALLEN
jgi:AcrR family transcriptional regulator